MSQRAIRTALLFAAPAALLAAVFVWPLLAAIGASVEWPALTLKHYERIAAVPVYQAVFLKTLRVAALTTTICLLLAYPTAMWISRLDQKARNLAVLFVTIPFLLSVLVRNYVWMILLQDTGLVNKLLLASGLAASPYRLMYNEFGVVMAMANMLVPYVLFPVLSALLSIPRDLAQASSSLGASPIRTFLHVTAPLTAPGAAAGSLLTFIVALGFYVTPAMLGGAKEMMVSNLIAFNVRELLNWPMAFSLATTLLATTLVLYFIYSVVVPPASTLKAA